MTNAQLTLNYWKNENPDEYHAFLDYLKSQKLSIKDFMNI